MNKSVLIPAIDLIIIEKESTNIEIHMNDTASMNMKRNVGGRANSDFILRNFCFHFSCPLHVILPRPSFSPLDFLFHPLDSVF